MLVSLLPPKAENSSNFTSVWFWTLKEAAGCTAVTTKFKHTKSVNISYTFNSHHQFFTFGTVQEQPWENVTLTQNVEFENFVKFPRRWDSRRLSKNTGDDIFFIFFILFLILINQFFYVQGQGKG